jgi:hypothetical protein
MIRLGPHHFRALRRAFDCATDGLDEWPEPPMPLDMVAVLRAKLAEADAASLPGLPVVLALSQAEIEALLVCWEVGGECDPSVTDDQYETVLAILGRV